LGIYEFQKQRHFVELVRKGDCVLDIGANVGLYSLLASRLAGETGRVIAFEPLPANLDVLRRHLHLNRVTNVTVLGNAVTDVEGKSRFACSTNPSMGSLCRCGESEVETVTLDGLWKRGVVPCPDVVKIDVEGAEAGVLRGAEQLLSECRPTIILSGHGFARQQECEDILVRLGYTVHPDRDGTNDGMYESIAIYES
jgi:FkbM family methyltransferase